MTKDDEEKYRSMWSTQLQDHVVLLAGAKVPDDCIVYDRRSRTALAMDDDQLNREIVSKLVEAGAPVLRDIPS